MRTILKKALEWSASKLSGIAANIDRRNDAGEAPSNFVDLAPTDQADESGVYSDALEYALGRPRVLNIALTGPYGSGKSSIIQSFLKRTNRRALHISLAAFLPEAGSQIEKVTRQEIERSILQQMLYGEDADKLPLSRFKRIRSPNLSATFVSIFVTIGLIALWHVLSQTSRVVDGSFFVPFIDPGAVVLGHPADGPASGPLSLTFSRRLMGSRHPKDRREVSVRLTICSQPPAG